MAKYNYNQYINDFRATLVDNPKPFWSFFRSKTRSNLPQVISDDNGIAASSKEKATLFNNYFYSVFTQPKDHLFFPNIPTSEHNSLPDIDLQPNSRVDTDVLMEVAYSCNFLAVSDSSTCPEIGTS